MEVVEVKPSEGSSPPARPACSNTSGRGGTRLPKGSVLDTLPSWVWLEICFVTRQLLKMMSQLFDPSFSGFWLKPLILELLFFYYFPEHSCPFVKGFACSFYLHFN